MKNKIQKPEIVRICSDQDCPKCGYPEVIRTMDLNSMELLSIECSDRKCDWIKKAKITEASR